MGRLVITQTNKIPREAKSAFVYTISQLFTRGLAIITVPVFTRLMSTEQVGVVNLYNSWYVILSVVATLSLTSGGFQLAMKEYKRERNQYMSSVLTITSLMTLLILGVYVSAPSFWEKMLGLPKELIMLMIVGLGVAPAHDFWMARQRYEYKYKLSGLISIITALVASILSVVVVVLLVSKKSLFVAEGRLFANYIIIYGVAGIIWLYIMFKGKTFFNIRYWNFSLSLSLPLVGYAIAKQVLDVSDRQMISKMVGNSEVGIYGTLYTVSSISLIVWNAINSSFIPYLYKHIENEESHKKLQKISSLLLGIYACVAILMTFLAPEIVKILATDEYYEAIYIMPPIAAGVFLTSVSHMYSNILVFYKKTSVIMMSSAIAAISNLVLNYFFIKSFGYQAAAYTTLFSYIILAVLEGWYAKKASKRETQVYNNKRILLLSVITIVISMCGMILYKTFVARYIACIIVFSIAIVMLMAKKHEE